MLQMLWRTHIRDKKRVNLKKKRDRRKKAKKINLVELLLSSWFLDNGVRPIRRYLCTLEYPMNQDSRVSID